MQNNRRFLSLDFLKGLGIFILVASHQMAWVLFADDLNGLRYEDAEKVYALVLKIVTHAGIPFWGFFFPIIAGASAYFSMRRECFKFKDLLIRIGSLLALGSFMNFLTWGIQDIFDWDVLQFIALSALVSYPFIKLTKKGWGFIPLVLLGIFSLAFSNVFPFKEYQDLYLYKILIGDIDGYHYWPLLPWFSLFASGVIVGWLFSLKKKKVPLGIMFVGLLLSALSFWKNGIIPSVDVSNVWGVSVFKPSPYYVVAVLGFGFFVLGLTQYLISRFEKLKGILEKTIFIYYGRAVLWVYIFSTICGYKMNLLISSFCSSIYQAIFVLPFMIAINLMICFYIAKSICSQRRVVY